jgi:pimeloyl-ACP methyl ester carboxylesterase
MRRLRRVLIGIIGAVTIGLALFGYFFAIPSLRIELVPTNSHSIWKSDFYLYISPTARAKAAKGEKLVILVQPNNSGVNSDDPQVHRSDAWWTAYGRHGVADELGVVLLVPAFPRPATDWKIYTHALDRDTLTTKRQDLHRIDLQLIAMIDATRKKLQKQGFESEDRILIQGFSASGMFANRFAALHPERVMAVAAGAPGGWPIAPVTADGELNLPYPGGIADVHELTGKRFDVETFRKIPQVIYLGSLDDNDSLDFGDGWEKEAAAPIQAHYGDTPLARWKHAERLYQRTGANTQFVLIEGEGHNRRRLQYLATDFFRQVLAKRQ